MVDLKKIKVIISPDIVYPTIEEIEQARKEKESAIKVAALKYQKRHQPPARTEQKPL